MEKILKIAKGKTLYTEQRSDYSSNTLQTKKQFSEIFRVLKEKTINLEFYIQCKYLSKIKVVGWAWWCTPVIPATQEAEAGELPETRRRRLR